MKQTITVKDFTDEEKKLIVEKYGFVMQKSSIQMMEFLSNDEIALFFKTVLNYNVYGVVPDLRLKEFIPIRPMLKTHMTESDKSDASYIATKRMNRARGSAGGKKKEENKQKLKAISEQSRKGIYDQPQQDEDGNYLNKNGVYCDKSGKELF